MKTHKFIDNLKKHAIKLNKEKGIKASLAIAQACLESGFGRYVPKDSYNIFGIKWTGSKDGDYVITKTREYVNGNWVVTEARFRKYKSWYDSLEDYGDFLINNKRYKNVVIAETGIDACHEVQKAGYATDPNYAKKLINIINQYGLLELDLTTMTIIVVDKNGAKHQVDISKTKNINGYVYLEGRTFTSIAGGKVTYDKDSDTAVFDFS